MPGFHLKKEIENFIKIPKEQNFYDLITYLYNNFLSWKIATEIPGYKIPTTRNLVEQLNILVNEEKIEIKCSEKYLKQKKYLKMLIKNKNEMKEIYLKSK